MEPTLFANQRASRRSRHPAPAHLVLLRTPIAHTPANSTRRTAPHTERPIASNVVSLPIAGSPRRETGHATLANLTGSLDERTESSPRIARPLTQRLLIAIRAALGLMFLGCGLRGFFDVAPNSSHHSPGSAIAFGGALVLTGSMIPLLKGAEVLLETLLEWIQGARSAASSKSHGSRR